MIFIKYICRHKVKSVIFLLLLYVIAQVSMRIINERISNNVLFKKACDNVIDKFVSDNTRQIEMMSRKMNIGVPGAFYIKTVDYYNRGLREKYTNNNYLTLLTYSSVDEFNKFNPDSCFAEKTDNIARCYNEMDPPFDEGQYICVYFNYKIRYKDEKGKIKILDEYADGDTNKKNVQNLISYAKDSAAVLKLERDYVQGKKVSEWKIIEWIDRSMYNDRD
ncbi:hypothetical protein [Citrobacter sp. Marseille-Q6884]|uniref:hypothetical protein n=1 Tax=Citrobacter sp. Marseille-Q6884 TaxID=2956786 RepID=UPI0021B1D59B|nr:hypothetical protein [Citrobacter sp. Marseille-Q6884]